MKPWPRPETVWKINGYIILLAGLVALGLLVTLAFTLIADKWAPRGVHNVVATNPEQILEEKLSYRLSHVGNDTVVVDMLTDQRINTKYGSKEAPDALRNQLFVTISTGGQRKLFPDNAKLITTVHAIKTENVKRINRWDNSEGEGETLARFYEVVTKDTNGDQRLTEQDNKTLMLARANGTGLVQLADEIADLGGRPVLTGKNLRYVTTRADGASALQQFDLETWQPLPSIPLPSLKEK